MTKLSEEALYAIDVLRFLAMDSESQVNLISGAGAPAWIRDHDPLRGAL